MGQHLADFSHGSDDTIAYTEGCHGPLNQSQNQRNASWRVSVTLPSRHLINQLKLFTERAHFCAADEWLHLGGSDCHTTLWPWCFVPSSTEMRQLARQQQARPMDTFPF